MAEPQSELQHPRAGGGAHHPESRRAQHRARQTEIGVVEGVEGLRAELRGGGFGELETLSQGEVEVEAAASPDDAAAGVAEGEWRRGFKGEQYEFECDGWGRRACVAAARMTRRRYAKSAAGENVRKNRGDRPVRCVRGGDRLVCADGDRLEGQS